MSAASEKSILQAFRLAALEGRKAPGNDELSDLVYSAGGARWRDSLDQLVKDGKISIAIAGKNWRIVTIVAEGISTAAEPNGFPAWLILDAKGRRRP